jgi:hypothetical protein
VNTSGWNKQVNWTKLRAELNKLSDVGKLRQDLQRIASDLRKFDFHTVLTPQALERVKTFEKKYSDLIKTVHQAQRQVDREMTKIIRHVKGHRLLADVKLDTIRRMAQDQSVQLTKAAQTLKKRWNGKPLRKKKTGSKKTKTNSND